MTPRIQRRGASPAAETLRAAGVDTRLAPLFAARGVSRATELDCSLAALPTFASMKNAESAAKRLADAIALRQRILIVADYDADGATACALGMRGLAAFGAQVDFLVPNRMTDGYGLTPEIVRTARARSPHLIVTVDNGIASHEGIEAAAALGIDVLVTDHHLPADTLPSPAIIVDPSQPGCEFPSRNIAGVGVMFYVLAATRAELRARGMLAESMPSPATWLDLVALGTVADVVRLDHVNRILVEQGLRRIRAGACCPGVRALFEVAGREARDASATDLGFVAGPRINAAGRMADMSLGIRCLVADDPALARSLALELDRFNRNRRDVEARMQEQALEGLDLAAFDAGAQEAHTLSLYQPDWHAGVVGIVASRLKDRLHRPAMIFARAESGELRGSGRSIRGLHLRDALDVVSKREPGLILRFGGHAMAAGVTIAEADFDRFSAAFEAVARDCLQPADLLQVIETDGSLARDDACIGFAQAVKRQVWGQGFPAPSFDDGFDVVSQRIIGGAHSRLDLRREGGCFEAMLFRQTEPLPPVIHAVYRPEIDRYQGLESVRMVVEHWMPG